MCNIFDIEGDNDGSKKASLVMKADAEIAEFEEMLSKF